MGKNGNFLNLTANISNWVARSAKLQQTCFVRHFVERLLRRKCCFYEKNWARNGNFSGSNEKIELMSLPISPIFFPIDLHRGQTLAKFGPNNSIWQEIRGLFFACKLKKFFVYWHRSVIPAPNFSFFLGLPSMKVSSFLDRTVWKRTREPQVACCYWEVAFFLLFLLFNMKFFVLYTFEIFKMIKVLKKVRCGLQNAHLKLYDVILASTA